MNDILLQRDTMIKDYYVFVQVVCIDIAYNLVDCHEI